MKLQTPTIETLEVTSLKTLPFNRIINLPHVTSLLNSMTKFGILRLPIILRTSIFGKTDNYILDAQHLIAALIKADHKTASCIVIHENNINTIIDTIAILNNTSSLWRVEDYVNAYSYMPGKEDYKLLKVHHLSTGFVYRVSAKILSGNTEGIKNGKFKINCSDADIMTKQLVDVSALFNTDKARFMLAYINFARSIKNYDHKRFMQLASKNKDSFLIIDDIVAMNNSLHDLYK